MHEAGHNSLTGDVVTDKWLQTLFYGAGCGMSASWWRSQHNRHHASNGYVTHFWMNALPYTLCSGDYVSHKRLLNEDAELIMNSGGLSALRNGDSMDLHMLVALRHFQPQIH